MKDLITNPSKLSESWWRIEAFLEMKSPNTQITYRGIINEWCAFLGAKAGSAQAAKLILAANDLHAIAYRKWLTSRIGQRPRMLRSLSKKKEIEKYSAKPNARDGTQATLTNSTIAKKFNALRRIYRMLIAAELGITKNPFDSDKVPVPSESSGQKRPTEMVDIEIVKKILSLPDITNERGLRDLAMLSLLFGAGLRRSEVTKLRLGDIKRTSKNTVFLVLRATKSKKDAEQALPTWCADVILELHSIRKAAGAADGDYLFLSYRGPGAKTPAADSISTSGLYKLFKYYCRMAGAGEFLSPHSARATAITRLLDQGFSHREVKEFSRHSSVQMVEVYDKKRKQVDESPGKKLNYD